MFNGKKLIIVGISNCVLGMIFMIFGSANWGYHIASIGLTFWWLHFSLEGKND